MNLGIVRWFGIWLVFVVSVHRYNVRYTRACSFCISTQVYCTMGTMFIIIIAGVVVGYCIYLDYNPSKHFSSGPEPSQFLHAILPD